MDGQTGGITGGAPRQRVVRSSSSFHLGVAAGGRPAIKQCPEAMRSLFPAAVLDELVTARATELGPHRRLHRHFQEFSMAGQAPRSCGSSVDGSLEGAADLASWMSLAAGGLAVQRGRP